MSDAAAKTQDRAGGDRGGSAGGQAGAFAGSSRDGGGSGGSGSVDLEQLIRGVEKNLERRISRCVDNIEKLRAEVYELDKGINMRFEALLAKIDALYEPSNPKSRQATKRISGFDAKRVQWSVWTEPRSLEELIQRHELGENATLYFISTVLHAIRPNQTNNITVHETSIQVSIYSDALSWIQSQRDILVSHVSHLTLDSLQQIIDDERIPIITETYGLHSLLNESHRPGRTKSVGSSIFAFVNDINQRGGGPALSGKPRGRPSDALELFRAASGSIVPPPPIQANHLAYLFCWPIFVQAFDQPLIRKTPLNVVTLKMLMVFRDLYQDCRSRLEALFPTGSKRKSHKADDLLSPVRLPMPSSSCLDEPQFNQDPAWADRSNFTDIKANISHNLTMDSVYIMSRDFATGQRAKVSDFYKLAARLPKMEVREEKRFDRLMHRCRLPFAFLEFAILNKISVSYNTLRSRLLGNQEIDNETDPKFVLAVRQLSKGLDAFPTVSDVHGEFGLSTVRSSLQAMLGRDPIKFHSMRDLGDQLMHLVLMVILETNNETLKENLLEVLMTEHSDLAAAAAKVGSSRTSMPRSARLAKRTANTSDDDEDGDEGGEEDEDDVEDDDDDDEARPNVRLAGSRTSRLAETDVIAAAAAAAAAAVAARDAGERGADVATGARGGVGDDEDEDEDDEDMVPVVVEDEVSMPDMTSVTSNPFSNLLAGDSPLVKRSLAEELAIANKRPRPGETKLTATKKEPKQNGRSSRR
ncbi:hypothetical protein HK105_201522 [Polyrhizophydium stewartii]|uniref:Uncharacterized protein n=1 Tax=Polyrhizophydium stewartii TaxID=2732419 RepID=A0ABR4NGM5_9FUNG